MNRKQFLSALFFVLFFGVIVAIGYFLVGMANNDCEIVSRFHKTILCAGIAFFSSAIVSLILYFPKKK